MNQAATDSGARSAVFDSAAITVLHEGTSGLLRDIDRVATDALKSAARSKVHCIDRALVTSALARSERPRIE